MFNDALWFGFLGDVDGDGDGDGNVGALAVYSRTTLEALGESIVDLVSQSERRG
jgi:hypothetical protein